MGDFNGSYRLHSAGRLPKEIRPPSDVADPGKGLHEREFAAFQKSLFERLLRETWGNRAEAARRLERLLAFVQAGLTGWPVPCRKNQILRSCNPCLSKALFKGD
ncbi:MAG: hypothetical protein DMG16_23180 [Acidobacteria bacterium]|nr:MAG: hypothetical protein DMG16_23180 [Acidobacteriota bacterium]